MQSKSNRLWLLLFLAVLLAGIVLLFVLAEINRPADLPALDIDNDQGGPVVITGSVTYTNPFFTKGVAQPLIVLEDQGGFVERDNNFRLPPESQVLGQITSDFFTSPFTYSLTLPIEPQGSLRDVDNNGRSDSGVMVFAVAYWQNTYGDPFLEDRDLGGYAWSTSYVSTRVSVAAANAREVIGGRLLVYAPDDRQGFPAGFGQDGRLFTTDDPIVQLPAGYTLVDLDTDSFTFDRSRAVVVDLLESEAAAVTDFSDLTYSDAFEAMLEKFRTEYAYTELKGLDWEALGATFRPRFAQAEAAKNPGAYAVALRDFLWSIPDAHIAGPFASIVDRFQQETGGGLGMAIGELDDGRVLVNFVLDDGPADRAGIVLRAEILELDGQPIQQAVRDNQLANWTGPFSTTHAQRLQQVRYVLRHPIGTEVAITYRNPDENQSTTTTLTTIAERESLRVSSVFPAPTGLELPVEYRLLDSGYAYVQIDNFSDNTLLTIQLWERLMRTLNEQQVPALIVDMRQNTGGSGLLADQMAAYFFDEELLLGNSGFYDAGSDSFYFNPLDASYFSLPAENLRYRGNLIVLIGPSCASACEFFSYDLTLQDRATVIGHYPSTGAGGSIEQFFMPEDETVQFSVGRNVDADGAILIEGTGIIPDVRVPVTEETLFSDGDPVLDAAVDFLVGQ